MFDVERVRADFPMLSKTMNGKPLIYLDTAATSQTPKVVVDTLSDYYLNHRGTVHRAVYELSIHASMAYSQVREKVQRFINAEHSEEILFTRGTTTSINSVALSFGKAFIQPGDEIALTETEHHANIVPWQMMAEERGAKIVVLPVNDQGELIMEEVEKRISSKTKLVGIVHISNATGTLNPVKEVSAIAHKHGAKVLVDGAQAAPSLPVDVQEIGCDFYAFSAHKLYGPTGVGVLYMRKELHELMPPYEGGGDMIDMVSFEKTTYAEAPLKYEAGTPMISSVLGLGTAIDYLTEIGMDAIHHWKQELLNYATPRIKEVPGLRIVGEAKEKGSLISFLIDGCHPLDIGTFLDLRGIAIRTGHLCAQPTMKRFNSTSFARASFGIYTTKEEIDRFVAALIEVVAKLK